MPVHKHQLEFERVVEKLRLWQAQVVDELRNEETHEAALQSKRQLDAAIECLEFCQRYQIRPRSQVVVLPETRTQTPSSDYRVLEDQETEQREHWIELQIEGEALHLYPGDIVIW